MLNELDRELARRGHRFVRYADDFVASFQYKEEAEEFYKHLKSRMGRFGMALEGSKTSRKKFTKKCKEVHRLIRDMRTKPLKANCYVAIQNGTSPGL